MLVLGDRYTLEKEETQSLMQHFEHIYTVNVSENVSESIKKIEHFLEEKHISHIVLNLKSEVSSEFQNYLKELTHRPITLLTFSELYTDFLHHKVSHVNAFNHKMLLEIKPHILQKVSKRLFDLSFSLVAMVLLLPVILIIALWIKIKSPEGSIFFTQVRLGLEGTSFTVYKFRTMVPNAEEVLEALLAHHPEIKKEYILYRKLKKDPRIIPGIGDFLRKTSLDELPQFLNVFLGHMSIVGPRPYLYEEFSDYTQTHIDIVSSVKPGITGLWQVTDRHESTFDSRVDTDLTYITSQTLWGDIKIIFKTMQVVFLRKGI